MSGLRTLFRKEDVERDLDDEVRQYLEMATREHMRGGLSRAAAERAARVELGGVEATKEQVRSSGWDAGVENFVRDVRYAARGLRRNPAFTTVVVLTLALGIGVNTAMFSVVDAVMLRPLPYHDAGRLALVWTDDTRRGLHREGTAFNTVLDWRHDNRTFADIAVFNTYRATLSGNGVRERTRSALVSANLFQVLGVVPSRGRAIASSDEANAERVAVISYSLWQRRFAADPAAIGRTIQIEENSSKGEGSAVTVIGVMPPGFFFPDKQTEVWTPATTYWRFQRESRERFAPWARRWTAIGRLKSNVSIRDARLDLSRIGDRLSIVYRADVPDFPGFATNVVPVLDFVAGKNIQTALWTLLGAVALVLLVACANVANLVLARGAARQQEFVIRRALGASRGRLVRQLVAESILVAIAGGIAGVILAVAGTHALGVIAVDRIPRIEEIVVDTRVLGFAAAVSLLAGIAFGLVPALRVSRGDATEVLKAGRQVGGSVQARRTRGLLVAAECALAIVLLAGAGLLLKSLRRLRSIEPGFDPRQVLTVRLEFPPEAAPAAERTQTSVTEPERARGRAQLLRDVTARLASIPGIDAVGFVDDMFMTGQANHSITIPGKGADSFGAGELNEGTVTPGFFTTMRVPLRRGRFLSDDDALTKIRALWSVVITDESLIDKERRATPEPVVVNEAFVRRFFANEDPLGKHFCIDPTNKTYWYVIVGVVGDMRRQGLEKEAIPEYFGAYIPNPTAKVDLVMRTGRRDPLDVAPEARRVVTAMIPNVLIGRVATADQQLGDFTAARDFQTWLLSIFAFLALGLAAVGIYGVVQYAVAERTREIGVRIALGATPADVRRLIVGQGMRMPGVGIAFGLMASFWTTRLMSRLLFNVAATDPSTFVAVAFVLAGVACVACYVPATRASRVDVVTALRQE